MLFNERQKLENPVAKQPPSNSPNHPPWNPPNNRSSDTRLLILFFLLFGRTLSHLAKLILSPTIWIVLPWKVLKGTIPMRPRNIALWFIRKSYWKGAILFLISVQKLEKKCWLGLQLLGKQWRNWNGLTLSVINHKGFQYYQISLLAVYQMHRPGYNPIFRKL